MRIGLSCDGAAPAEGVLGLLAAAGLPAEGLPGVQPPALVETGAETWLLAGPHDVLLACAGGGLDLAVVGKDALLEDGFGVAELLDLRCCPDELVHAGAPWRAGRRARVATRYPRTARRHFAQRGAQPDVIVADEPVLAVALGLADGVVELTSRLSATPPGAAGDLTVRGVVAACGPRLVAGRAARILLGARLGDLLERLRTAMEAA